jgi:osmotically-inducible protein OsmY
LALLAGGTTMFAQTVPTPADQAKLAAAQEQVVLSAIRSHPLTAPYPITASSKNGKVVLGGIVGTKQVHDLAVRLAIGTGVPFRDDLIIDTAAAGVVAQSGAVGVSAMTPGTQGVLASSPYIYPPPLFGRLDDPFFGFVPPIISYPPWWKRNQAGPMAQSRNLSGAAAPAAALQANNSGANGALGGGWQPQDVNPVKGQVEIIVDISGQVFLRGSVVSEQVKREIEETARSVPGVANVISELTVIPRRADADTPPPPPVPMLGPAAAKAGEPAADARVPGPAVAEPRVLPERPAPAPAALDSQSLTRRVVSALGRRPQAAELPVKVHSANGVVTLSGQVPSAFEAMLVYRAAQQTPGVREIVDHLEFTVPDENHPNPLLQRGRPEDIEPYLSSQINRHVAELAHIDRLQARGRVLELRGTLQRADDQDRLMAILRSIPVLQGFRLETNFKAE